MKSWESHSEGPWVKSEREKNKNVIVIFFFCKKFIRKEEEKWGCGERKGSNIVWCHAERLRRMKNKKWEIKIEIKNRNEEI